MAAISNDWQKPLSEEFKKPYYRKLYETVKQEYTTHTVFPPSQDIFNAFALTPLSEVKVLILGQDPYHEPGQAHGLCFSVRKGVSLPPSLRNIYKELYDETGIPPAANGDLTKWAQSGVLLLNTVLTVRRGQANSHKGMGWEIFTDHVIQKLNERSKPIVFILWGSNARSKKQLITSPQHLILEAQHPSPLSAKGFFGCGHFVKCNEFLDVHGIERVDWHVE